MSYQTALHSFRAESDVQVSRPTAPAFADHGLTAGAPRVGGGPAGILEIVLLFVTLSGVSLVLSTVAAGAFQ